MGDDARTPVEEPLWKRIILAVPRGFGSLVRSVAGVGEFDPVYRRDGLCFLLIVLAVFFCASEWFRVNGIIGRVLHAFSAGVLGVMSVVLPVLLVIVAIRLMRNSGKNSDNPRVVSGWAILLWSVCSIIDVVVAADARSFDIGLLQRAGGLLGFVLGSPLAWGLSKVFAVIVFVVVGLFSLLMITRTHVTQVPDRVRTIAAMISQRSLHPRQEPDSAAQQDQFPNEVRVGDGDETLAFAEGVPAHDGTDETESDSVGAKGGWFSRLFRRKSAEKTDDASLDRYAGDDPFSHAASRHGQAAETSLDARGNVMPRTVSSTMGAMAGAAAGAMSGAMSGGVAAAHAADAVATMTSGMAAAHPGAASSGTSGVPAYATDPDGAAGSARLVSSTVAGTSDPWAAMPAAGAAGAISPMSPDASSGASAGAGENMNPNVDDPALAAPDAPYQLPDLNMLSHGQPHAVRTPANDRVIRALTSTFQQFNVDAKVVGFLRGPSVTQYEVELGAGVKVEKVTNLQRNIAYAVASSDVRILSPIPGKSAIGIEIPNDDREIVHLGDVLRSDKAMNDPNPMLAGVGKDVEGHFVTADLTKMPHLLVAGATGQGKSVGLNAIITSLLYKKHPSELKLVLVDPKKVELTLYGKLERHFLAKLPGEDDAIITDTHKVIYTLNSLCIEMDARYDLLRKAEVRHVKEYNDKFRHRKLNPQKGHRFLPYIIVVIDEFADLIMTAGREVETPIARIAQLARAVGIHLVIATQRPTTNIITGVIKANFPARIAFRVTSMIDSRTIIDQPGANQLIGRGDMLVSTGNDLTRVQCAFVDTPEIERITEFISNQRGYLGAYELPEYNPDSADNGGSAGGNRANDLSQLDAMFDEVAHFVVQNQQGSTSSIQRRFSIGYNRAGRIMDQLEMAGVVGRAEGSKPREVLIQDVMSLEHLLAHMND